MCYEGESQIPRICVFVQQWFNNQAKSLTTKAAASQRTIHLCNSRYSASSSSFPHLFTFSYVATLAKCMLFLLAFFVLSVILCRLAFYLLEGTGCKPLRCWAGILALTHTHTHTHLYKSATKTLMPLCWYLLLPLHLLL